MLEIIVTAIFIATVMNILFTKFHIPTIIGYIITGLILAYTFGLHSSNKSHDLEMIAEFGIVFLMFTIGLEFSVKHLSQMKKEVFLYGGLQVGISMLFFYLLSHYVFGLDIRTAIIVASALALSSTAIVLKLLGSSRDISKEYGKRSLGILIFQDIMVIPILLMIGIFSAGDVDLTSLLFKTFIDAIILFFVLWIFGLYILEPFLSQVVKSNSDEIFIGSILFLVMGASLLAHSLGFSYSLGALIAGMIIAETQYKHQVEADLIPFRDILLGIFFITVGMQIDFAVIGSYFFIIIGLLLFLGLSKMLIIYLILQKATIKRVALKTSLALFQLGEFGLVVFELAGSKNLVDPILSQILIITIILSMILTPFVLSKISSIADLIFGDENSMEISMKKRDDLEDHIIVLGYGRLGRKICEKLDARGVKYLAIENNIHNVMEANKLGKRVIFGNAAKRTILESVNLHRAASIIVAIDNNDKVHLVCDALKKIAPNIPVIINVNRFHERDTLHAEYPDFQIVVGTEQMARGMVDSMLKCDIVRSTK
jgi:CPA2 family monovalent cation:H+ antiporter-2